MNHKENSHIPVSSLPRYPYYYTTHFLRGTHINVDNNKTEKSKLVENLKAEDFQNVEKLRINDQQLQMVIGRLKEINLESFETNINLLFSIEKFINEEEQHDLQVNIYA